ncbi:syncytin-1-like [Cynocephalus volans]|uniref:syncytin-1-like n=1 Tax=Cynocephalus volans TaxID=110931 RepID=UPI002FCBE518
MTTSIFFLIVGLSDQLPKVQSGFGDPGLAHQLVNKQYGKPCDCKGGTVSSPPTSYISVVDCDTHSAYLSSSSPAYSCVEKPKFIASSGGSLKPCPCSTFAESMHSTCYSSYQLCTSGNQTYFTATLIKNYVGTFGGDLSGPPSVGLALNKYAQASCTGLVGQPVCWSTTPLIHISDGGGPQDQTRILKVETKIQEMHEILFPQLTYHPLALPKNRGDLGLDPQTSNILYATHKLLNATNPDLAQNCWLCLIVGQPVPVAFPALSFNYSDGHQCSLTFPLQVQPLQFYNATCFISPSVNNSFEVDVGFATFANCQSFINISTSLCSHNSSVFVCGSNEAYTQLPTNWTGLCVLALLLPDVDVISGSEPVPVPTFEHIAGRSKRAVQFIPLLAGLGISAAVATGTAGLTHSLSQYTKLSTQLISDVQALSQTIQDLQDQLDSLAEVVLQNRRGLDLLTAEQGGVCLALQERCCIYANKSGIVRDRIKQLQDDLEKRRKQLAENPLWTGLNGFLPYLLPFLGQLVGLLLLLSLGPFLLNKVTAFVKQQIEAIQARPIQVHYQRLEMQEQSGAYIPPHSP